MAPSLLVILLCSLSLSTLAQAAASSTINSHALDSRANFVHPGLDFFTTKQTLPVSNSRSTQRQIRGDTVYAKATATTLGAWSSTLTFIDGTSDKFLASGIYGYQLANAAEILRGYSGWTGLAAMNTLLEKVFYAMNHDFVVNHNGAKIVHYWANWDLANLCTKYAIGVLSDNATITNEAVNYFKSTAGNGAIQKTIWAAYTESGSNKILGQNQEAGRDQGHAMLDYALLGVLAQQTYNQGNDYLATFLIGSGWTGPEYAAKYNLGFDVPYTTYVNSDVTQTTISNGSRGNIRPIWELIYGHYGSLKGLNASWSKQYRGLVVSNGGGAEGGGGDYGTNSGGYDQLGFDLVPFCIGWKLEFCAQFTHRVAMSARNC
ncbi:gpi anchored [Trichoderma arundinaceum]|uniref:Gpi anchored n=1 Tax=Trichoderma arundinaceum TaxID=490622 RepID=A0A395NYN1_TRIAR|nr:gpi anchored [Trichoderma arundinaceum]